MAKKSYTLVKNKNTGGWFYYCKNDPLLGSNVTPGASKREARRQAAAHCDGVAKVVPPDVDADVRGGELTRVRVPGLDGEGRTYSGAEFPLEELSFAFGLDCFGTPRLSKRRKVAAVLKAFGVFRGGTTDVEIRRLHNMPMEVFDLIAQKNYSSIVVTVDGERLEWTTSN
jgi:hypothetical protein